MANQLNQIELLIGLTEQRLTVYRDALKSSYSEVKEVVGISIEELEASPFYLGYRCLGTRLEDVLDEFPLIWENEVSYIGEWSVDQALNNCFSIMAMAICRLESSCKMLDEMRCGLKKSRRKPNGKNGTHVIETKNLNEIILTEDECVYRFEGARGLIESCLASYHVGNAVIDGLDSILLDSDEDFKVPYTGKRRKKIIEKVKDRLRINIEKMVRMFCEKDTSYDFCPLPSAAECIEEVIGEKYAKNSLKNKIKRQLDKMHATYMIESGNHDCQWYLITDIARAVADLTIKKVTEKTVRDQKTNKYVTTKCELLTEEDCLELLKAKTEKWKNRKSRVKRIAQ